MGSKNSLEVSSENHMELGRCPCANKYRNSTPIHITALKKKKNLKSITDINRTAHISGGKEAVS